MSAVDTLRTVRVEEALLSKNRTVAERLRARFRGAGLLVVNLLSSPGSGKTSLLERTLKDRGSAMRAAVVVGDLATDNDGRRLSGHGAPVVQIETGDICHLDAAMVERALEQMDLSSYGVLFIENVGNLVCPTAYDLGEERRAAVLSVTEGEDKPLKYPAAFRSADVIILSKSDLMEAAGFNRSAALASISRVAPRTPVLELSSRTGGGMDAWYAWLEERMVRKPSG